MPERIRKQVYDLTLADLEQSPVWQFALDEEGEDGQDEATVRPFAASEPVDPGEGGLIVRAEFRLADGSSHMGFLTLLGPDERGDLGLMQPCIVTPHGHIAFWFGMASDFAEKRDAAYAALGKRAADVFPLTFGSTPPVEGGEVSGQIEGFMRYASFLGRRSLKVFR